MADIRTDPCKWVEWCPYKAIWKTMGCDVNCTHITSPCQKIICAWTRCRKCVSGSEMRSLIGV